MVVSAERWWRQPDQFDWFSAYLRDRGLQSRWRATTFVFTVLLALIPVVLIASPTGPDRPVTIGVSLISSLVAAASGVLWLRRWPTRRQSMLFSMVAIGVIAVTCLSQSDPYAALMGCTTFAIIGGFVAYFHTVALMTVNLGAAMACAVIGACRLLHGTGDVALAASAFLIVIALNVGVPFGIHSLAHSLRSDLRNSGFDPLTGLLNRGAFYRAAHELQMQDSAPSNRYLVVTLVDLDEFKQLNDTQGHAAGDQALISVAAALRENSRDTAVIGRIGGEEFVIADRHSAADPAPRAEWVRAAIEALPYPVTASVGTCGAPLAGGSLQLEANLVERLVRAADSAMYEAKRAGGNQVRHRPDFPAPHDTHGL